MKTGVSLNNWFTIIQIMIVVATIGLLATIAIANYVKARGTSQTDACIRNLRQIDRAVERWALENNKPGGDTVTSADVVVYIGRKPAGDWPVCPASGACEVTT